MEDKAKKLFDRLSKESTQNNPQKNSNSSNGDSVVNNSSAKTTIIVIVIIILIFDQLLFNGKISQSLIDFLLRSIDNIINRLMESIP